MSDPTRTPTRTPSTQSFSPPIQPNLPQPSPSILTSHRQSFAAESRRNPPPSPRMRSERQPSMGQQAFTDLLNNPPLAHESDGTFVGRDWKALKLGDIIDPGLVHWVELGTSVEDATARLIEAGSPNVLLVRRDAVSEVVVGTFDYKDLNAYLLLAVGLAHPTEGMAASYTELIRKIKEGKTVYLRDIQELGQKEEIIVTKQGGQEVAGVLTQLRLVRFFWEQGRHFEQVHALFQQTLHALGVGPRIVHSINGDKPLIEALELMANESISSLPVLDNHSNVIGNISQVDVKLLTKSTSLPLLNGSCIHFITVILNERGVQDGKDSFPVFHISPYSTFAHTIAKLVATRSHRMWITDPDAPPTPPTPTTPVATTATHTHAPVSAVGGSPTHGPPFTVPGSTVTAASLPGQFTSGRLIGVISLTDVLNLIARASGLQSFNPDEARRRRRSSSANTSVRGSMDSGRSSVASLVGGGNSVRR